MKRTLSTIVVALFLAGIFIVPVGVTNTPARLQETLPENKTFEQETDLSWVPADKTIRVALYNETNSTIPAYTIGSMNTNYSFIFDVFVNAGYQVTRLTFQEILDHELITANYDVFVLADNCPRENITDLVREFWLGGGGILSFDSSIGYLGYAGILPREDLGVDDGLYTYWDYLTEDTGVVSTRHPVTKSHPLGEQLAYDNTAYAQYDWTALMTTSIASSLTKLTVDDDDSTWAQAVAMDPTDMGGKVVQLGIPIDPWASAWENVMIDAVDWLCPRPKARIVFDLTHQPYYGVDEWEEPIVDTDNMYVEWRNTLVNRTYTFDKLWPSATGNLTAENLDGYDMLIIVMPDVNFTAAEVTAVTNWVNAGGSLLVLGSRYTYTNQRLNVNFLLNNYGLEWNSTTNENGGSNIFGLHPVCEGLSMLHPVAGGVVDVQSPAVPLVTTEYDHIVAGAQDYGLGRVVLISDIHIFDSDFITDNDNLQFAINIANWLTAGDVLVYASIFGSSANPNTPNPYRGPIASALNNLGISYLLTSNFVYFNLSLVTENTELAIIDQVSSDFTSPAYYISLLDHLKDGGKLIMSTWQMRTDSYPELIPLWDYLGVQYAGNYFTSPPAIYLWDNMYPVFTTPSDYGADNLTTTIDYCVMECANLTVYDNATAIAGLGTSQSTTNASIIIGANGQAITNGMILTGYSEDTDDSTYADSIEIWQNEIAFLMRPTIDTPVDIEYELGDSGNVITWVCDSDSPFEYAITQDAVDIESDVWDGSSRLINIDGLDVGTYAFEITVWDTVGNSVSDEVIVIVEDTTAPAFVDGPNNLQYQEGVTEHLLNWSFSDLLHDSYVLYINGTMEDSGAWDGTEISVSVGGLTEGVYNVTLAVNDTSGNLATSRVYLTVTEASTSTTTTTTTIDPTTDTDTTTLPPGDNTVLVIIIIIAAFGVIVIILKKRS